MLMMIVWLWIKAAQYERMVRILCLIHKQPKRT